MTQEFWITLGFSVVVWLILWAVGRYVLPRLNIAASPVEMKEAQLRRTVEDLERRLKISEDENNDCKKTQTFLLGELQDCNVRIVRQGDTILELQRTVELGKQEVSSLTRRLEDKKLIDKKPIKSEIEVLMVVPRSNLLLVDAETEDVLRSGLEVTPLFSPVAQVTLTREIRKATFDGLWLAGHMDKDGNFLLDNNEVLSSTALVSLVRGRFKWVFLNTCQNVGTAQMLQNETDTDVICTIADVPDIEAYRTGSLFANALARNGNTREAYDQSKPGSNRIYLYLGNGRKK